MSGTPPKRPPRGIKKFKKQPSRPPQWTAPPPPSTPFQPTDINDIPFMDEESRNNDQTHNQKAPSQLNSSEYMQPSIPKPGPLRRLNRYNQMSTDSTKRRAPSQLDNHEYMSRPRPPPRSNFKNKKRTPNEQSQYDDPANIYEEPIPGPGFSYDVPIRQNIYDRPNPMRMYDVPRPQNIYDVPRSSGQGQNLEDEPIYAEIGPPSSSQGQGTNMEQNNEENIYEVPGPSGQGQNFDDEPIYAEIGPPSSSQGQGTNAGQNNEENIYSSPEYRPPLPPRNVRLPVRRSTTSAGKTPGKTPRRLRGLFGSTKKFFKRRNSQ